MLLRVIAVTKSQEAQRLLEETTTVECVCPEWPGNRDYQCRDSHGRQSL